MPVQNSIYNYSILAAGGSVALNVRSPYTKYVIGAPTSVVLLADQEFISTGTPNEGCTFYIEYLGNIVSDSGGGKTVSFFGVDLTDAQANGRCDITAYYTAAGTWNVSVRPDLSEQQFNPVLWGYLIEDGSIDTTKIGPNKVTLAKLARQTDAAFLVGKGAGADVDAVVISSDIAIDSTGVATIQAGAITNSKLGAQSVTTDKISTALQTDCKSVSVSFETGELGAYKIKMPYPGTFQEVYAEAVKAIAATDSATVILKDNAGTTMTVTTPIVFAASDAFGTVYSSAITANNTFIAGDVITINTAKATAGGKALVTLKILRT